MKNFKCKNNIIYIHQLGFKKDDSVRTLYEVTEGVDYSKLYEAYSTEGRNPMLLPETLFRIVAYGYMEGIYSSRKLEKACKRYINVDGAFAVIKQDYGFRRFLMRGNKKVRIELLIMAFAYNVNKLHNKTLQGRNGELLHEPKGA